MKKMDKVDLDAIKKSSSLLMNNAYTVHQTMDFMDVAPLFKIYSYENEKIIINEEVAKKYSAEEILSTPDISIDKLTIWDKVLTSDHVFETYSEMAKTEKHNQPRKQKELTAAVWNIYHGGKHRTIEEHGFDSRMRIAETLKKENADVILMQETYSSGDFIAAELGYYFATTADYDYLNQGANISVLSRYPIKEVFVPASSPFMNVAAKISLSKTQDIFVMSNWYGMSNFPKVYEFHEERFSNADEIPVLFGGDFNAVPHTDGGESPASKKMLANGFTDAFRSLFPDVELYPGLTHQGGYRIDQLYYKGNGLENTSTKVIPTDPREFTSDHYLIISKFELK